MKCLHRNARQTFKRVAHFVVRQSSSLEFFEPLFINRSRLAQYDLTKEGCISIISIQAVQIFLSNKMQGRLPKAS
mgnify:CR=1 FL=1